MYLSPFTDIYGSRIIFAGPHKVFANSNKYKVELFSHGSFSHDIMEEEIDSSD